MVKVRVTDPEGSSATDEATVEIKNVAPTITDLSGPTQPLTGKALSLKGTAADPSAADTSAGFSWQWATGGGAYSPGPNPFGHTFSTCGEQTVSARAKDKDGGTSEPFKSGVVNVYEAHFRQPLDESVNNTVQRGKTVPVKISIGCESNPLTGLQPAIKLLKGDQTPERETSSDAIETLASSTDTTGIMRPVEGGYIYNLKVPGNAQAGAKFTIRVRPFGDSNTEASMYVVLKIK